MKIHCIYPKEKFLLLPQEQRKGPVFKILYERLSPEIDIKVQSPTPILTEPAEA